MGCRISFLVLNSDRKYPRGGRVVVVVVVVVGGEYFPTQEIRKGVGQVRAGLR